MFVPTLRALGEPDGRFRGVLYGGLMLTPDRGPMVIECNCRFGDPETQVVLVRLDERSRPLARAARRRGHARGRPACAPRRRGLRGAGCRGLSRGTPRLGDPITGLLDRAAATWSCSTPARGAKVTAGWSPRAAASSA